MMCTAGGLRFDLLRETLTRQNVLLNENSDIQGITEVLEDLIQDPRGHMEDKTVWSIEWRGRRESETQLLESSELLSFFQALAQNQYMEKLEIYLPFDESDDLAAVITALKTGRNRIKKIHLRSPRMEYSRDSEEFHQMEFLDALDAMGNWMDLEKVFFTAPLHPNPEFLKKVAPKLASLAVRDLEVALELEDPPNVYPRKDWKLAFSCLEKGLKSNYTLRKLEFSSYSDSELYDDPLNQTLKTLGKQHFSHWLQLNKYGSKVGRKHVQFMQNWFDIVALYASVDLNTLYHYLRLDPGMMFSSSSSPTATSTTDRKRSRDDDDEEDAKNMEIQRLRAQLDRQKKELLVKDAQLDRQKKELDAKDSEIERLKQAKLSSS